MVKAKENTTSEPTQEDFEQAPGWRPNKGERVTGTVSKRTVMENKWGKYTILTLAVKNAGDYRINEDSDDEEGTMYPFESGDFIAWHAFHTVAKNALNELRPPEGMEIEVTYLGPKLIKGKPKNSSDPRDYYHGWTVRDTSIVYTDDDFYGKVEEDSSNWATGEYAEPPSR